MILILIYGKIGHILYSWTFECYAHFNTLNEMSSYPVHAELLQSGSLSS